ncbi:MAG: OmpA family protein [Deltaproteobacteria bacterium]|nr:OmpA family protein [Deltaproteobacteria bacterium]
MKKGILLAALCLLTASVGCAKRGPATARTLNRVHFDLESASIGPDMFPVMKANSSYLKKHKINRIVVEGHCDERGTNEFNLALGDERANAAKDYLASQGFDGDSIRTVSYGEERPVDLGHDEAAWYMNRRAEFLRQ